MGDGIGFEEAGARFIPLVGLDGDLFSEEGSGFRGGAASFFVLDADGLKESVDGSWRDFEEGLGDLRGEGAEGLDVAGQPEGEDGLQAFGAGEIGGEPDFF